MVRTCNHSFSVCFRLTAKAKDVFEQQAREEEVRFYNEKQEQKRALAQLAAQRKRKLSSEPKRIKSAYNYFMMEFHAKAKERHLQVSNASLATVEDDGDCLPLFTNVSILHSQQEYGADTKVPLLMKDVLKEVRHPQSPIHLK